MGEIKHLQRQNEDKNGRITVYQCIVCELEQNSRMNDMIIIGSETTHPLQMQQKPGNPWSKNYLDHEVTVLFKNKCIHLDRGIKDCHLLPRKSPTKNKNGKPFIILIRLINRKQKKQILNIEKG